MPTYEYVCPRCGMEMSVRRLFSEMEEPTACLHCGAIVTRKFSANGNIQVPIHFRQWRDGGAPGGGQYSWNDFHDVSEKDLAKVPGVEKYERIASGPGRNRSKR